MNQAITVVKRDASGAEVMRYSGIVQHRGPDAVVVEAYFGREDMPFLDTLWKKGDRFIEAYYLDRWYNIFEIHDRDDDRIKGWYCNICRPALWENESQVSYEDLALDLWVAPDGTQTILDEDEFAALHLDQGTVFKAREALRELQLRFSIQHFPGL